MGCLVNGLVVDTVQDVPTGVAVLDAVAAADRDKTGQIAKGQNDGHVSDRVAAEEPTVTIAGLSILGVPGPAMSNDQRRRRRSIVEAVRWLTEPEGEQR